MNAAPPGFLRRHADLILALALFAALTALSWRRWASFQGDLNREWTTPARLAAGERLYRDVAFYYGPLAPHLEALAMRAFGARVGTAIGFGIVAAAGTLAALLLASRRFLSPLARCAVASVAVGVFAFAPGNGAFIAPYSMAALLAVGFAWLSFALAAGGGFTFAAIAGGLAVLAKPESAVALAGPLLLLPWAARVRFLAISGGLALGGYGLAMAGIPLDELARYGPLRHLSMPAEFAELYRRISGLHPSILPRAVTGLLAGTALLAGWLLLASALDRRRVGIAAAGAALVLAGALLRNPDEPLLTTVVRGLPLALVVAAAAAFRGAREGDGEARVALAAALVGLAFSWRTFFWTVPLFPYAPLAAVSLLPGVAYLAGRAATGAAGVVALLPFLLAPLAALPRLTEWYRSPRQEVRAPRGVWVPPGEEGPLYSALVAHLTRAGVRDRSLVALPESSALNFLLGVRSPLRLEQLLPGLFDEGADADAAARMTELRPERVVWVERSFAEYGGAVPGRDYALGVARVLARDYVAETRLRHGGGEATVFRRRDLPAP